MSATSATHSAKDVELAMIVKLRRLFPSGNQGESEKMTELKLLLQNHLPSEILQPGREFPELFDALRFKNKISLGEYRFLCEVFKDFNLEAEMITMDYQAKILNILGQEVAEQERDILVDKSEVVNILINTKFDYSKIVEAAVNKSILELEEDIECRKNVSKMAQVALQGKEKQ